MGLASGARVGDYEIVGPLGTGGMSEVYRARDLTLEREVAIKVLPAELAKDPEKRGRFEREAQLLAALNHRNIAVIHGVHHDGDVWYLVLELVPGETLAERLKRGPLELAEARTVFGQIARALEAAHIKGIIHRDLKPANVKITSDGTVKLLDFGLGKELVRDGTPSRKTETFDGNQTSHQTSHQTSPGLIIGTPGYMSPEQTRGRATARGTDIWAFGVCLFEALAGVHPFARDTVPDILSAILNDDPPWRRLPTGLPRAWRTLLERCLRKDEDARLRDAGDVRIEIEDAPIEDESPRVEASRLPRWVVPAIATLAALLAFSVWRPLDRERGRGAVVRRFVLELPPTAPLSLEGASALAVSPDGGRLVYTARTAQASQLYGRALDQLDTVPIPGTAGGVAPFFSPDGNTLGFFADDRLKTLSLPGGTPVSLADAPAPRGASWTDARRAVVFSPSSRAGLSAVPSAGGAPRVLTEPEGETEPSHRWPDVLPDGKRALVTLWARERTDVGVVELATGDVSRLVENGAYARYAPSGHVVFIRDDDVYAGAFDAGSATLGSEPIVVIEGVAYDRQTGAAFFAFSADGALFYVDKDSELESPATMLRVGVDGVATPIGAPRASLQVPRISPDGRFITATVQEDDATDVWSLSVDRGAFTRLTFDGTSGGAIWSPDGRRIAFSASPSGGQAVFWKAADGSGDAERLTAMGTATYPTSFSPDGETLLYSQLGTDTGLDIWMRSMSTGQSRPLIQTEYAEASAVFSPTGRFIAYTSRESGRDEVYVRAFSLDEGRWQISTEAGNEPMWSRDGSELFFRSGTSLMVADIVTDPRFEAGKPRRLVEAPFDNAGALFANYDVQPDGRNFVMIRSEENAAASRIHVVLHWFDELARRVRPR